MRLIDSYTASEINEIDVIEHKPEDERTEEEQSRFDEFMLAVEVNQMIEAARAEEIAKAANDRLTASLTTMENALISFGEMYQDALARLERIRNEA